MFLTIRQRKMRRIPESLRVLKLLLYKNYLVRRRQWLVSLIGEILVPIFILACIWSARDLNATPPLRITNDTHYRAQSKAELIDRMIEGFNESAKILYAPESEFTAALMAGVRTCFRDRAELYSYKAESELLADYYRSFEKGGWNVPSVIFDASSLGKSTQHLKYKIRSKHLAEKLPFNVYELTNLTDFFTEENYFVQVQLCLDESFVRMNDPSFDPQISVQQVPYPPYTAPDLFDLIFRQLFGVIFTMVFMIPLFIETAKASNEKFLGVNVLMSMNGVSNALNLFSWLLSGVVFVVVCSVLPIILVIRCSIEGNVVPYLHYSSTFIVLLVFTCYVTQIFCYGIHVSAYFARSLYVMFAILIMNMVASTVHRHALNDDNVFMVPYFGVLFPNLLLVRAVEEINYYEIIGDGVHWNNIFAVANEIYGTAGSVGGMLLCSLFGTVVHFTLACYVYAINPGRFGVPKHPFYFLKLRGRKVNTDYRMDNLVLNHVDEKLFEPENGTNYEPGIQIRGLRKIYNIGLFRRMKVDALRGISVDFYKGHITVLLGHNGAGKTTMMSILTGMRGPSDGIVLINSKDIKQHSKEIMNDMGLCTQENMLFPSLTVGEQLEFFAMLKGKDQSKSAIQKNVTVLLAKFKLTEKKDCLPNQLSGGQKRRVCLGMALVGDSNTLILDEPTSGLDPENRRIIWDVLLKMRGEKTILISTHDMEEADILGDRIAILHGGQLRSCGTSMYLKKLIGQNNVELTLSVEPSCDVEVIRDELKGRAKVTNQDGSKIVMSIPYSDELPDSLDQLESKKSELGISGLSVSLISLEQVYLKVTREEDDAATSRQPFFTTPFKVTGKELTMKSIKALLSKKMTYTLKNPSTITLKLLLVFMALLSISLVLKEANFSKITSRLISLSLKMYHRPVTYFQSFDDNLGRQYTHMTQKFRGRSVQVKDSSVTGALLKFSEQQFTEYNNHLIAAVEFSRTPTGSGLAAKAFYSGNMSYGFPISVNLMMNTLAKAQLGNEYEISVSSQQLPSLDEKLYKDISIVSAYTTAVLVAFYVCPAVSLFAIHPLRESTSSFKQLQTMTGVSCLAYWGTIFLFDMLVYLILIILILFGFAVMDFVLDLRIFMYNGMWISFLLYMLFAINSLPFVYAFSFLNRDSSSLIRLLTYISLGLITVEIIMHTVRSELGQHAVVRGIRTIQKGIFLLVPYVSFFHGQVSYHLTAQNNARCVKMPNEFYDIKCSPFPADLCCLFGCRDGKCASHIEYFNDFKYDISLEESLVYLGVTPFLYLGILVALECQLVQKLRARARRTATLAASDDEQVQRSKAAISARINGLREGEARAGAEDISMSALQDGPVQFMVYELRKRYGELSAVRDVSFAVRRKECFGLLGVNGAGKSTTFRMMTGAEVPDSGLMYMGDKDFARNRRHFLSRMGYCPQHGALVSSLDARDHLRLFARLRGIPELQVELEVQTWIRRLNLTACASQPSGTYSGGNKRRLNIAIALIGIPDLVLLDEPTTGVDPGARHSLWNVVQSCQTTGQAVVLTSHSMEECEALCNRLAIMVGGRLVCIGPSQELKQRFGAGYDIQMKLNPEKARDQVDAIKADMVDALRCELADENLGHLVYHVTPRGTSWRKMYDLMNAMKSRYDCIDDFSVLSSTLEQLFLMFARAANQDSTRMLDCD
ncbi:ATP-binding cassette sub-family A member 7-like isoform X2 [Phymastichus coffea]|uniref:ATP-binding cassette sub-family A member 7-like isoform X2 n=1 Tax=Phymastichus coffea TaxID=108790 RepID=UPI00273B05C0|nr:ATP-binding cassette sub-family A member 7-like isoform X2 [Phymastichus coffea]